MSLNIDKTEHPSSRLSNSQPINSTSTTSHTHDQNIPKYSQSKITKWYPLNHLQIHSLNAKQVIGHNEQAETPLSNITSVSSTSQQINTISSQLQNQTIHLSSSMSIDMPIEQMQDLGQQEQSQDPYESLPRSNNTRGISSDTINQYLASVPSTTPYEISAKDVTNFNTQSINEDPEHISTPKQSNLRQWLNHSPHPIEPPEAPINEPSIPSPNQQMKETESLSLYAYWGDEFIPNPPLSTFRIHHLNYNGFKLGRTLDPQYLAIGLHTIATSCNPHLLSCNEINVNIGIIKIKHLIQQTVKTIFPYSFHRLTQSPDKIDIRWNKPGGTAMIITNSFAPRVIDKGSDPIGRWTFVTLQGRRNKQITFITAYRVSDKFNHSHGSLTIQQQEYRSLLLAGHPPTVDPR